MVIYTYRGGPLNGHTVEGSTHMAYWRDTDGQPISFNGAYWSRQGRKMGRVPVVVYAKMHQPRREGRAWPAKVTAEYIWLPLDMPVGYCPRCGSDRCRW